MKRKFYVTPACELVIMTSERMLATSVLPTGTPGSGNKDASESPWDEHGGTTGGVGIGGDEFSGDDW